MKDTIVSLAKQLIAIPSVKGNEREIKSVLDLVKKELRGFSLKEFERGGVQSLLFFNTPTLPKKFTVLFNVHLDVVPATEEQFHPFEKDGRLYGRGAVDMKAGAASMITLFKQLAHTLSYPLGLQIVTDEEVGGHNGTKYQIEQGVKADFVISPEVTDLMVSSEAKGIVWVRAKATGETGHASYLWKGKNALWKLKHFLDRLERVFPEPTKEDWITTVNLASIETTNKTLNKIPEDASALFDIRYIPKEKNEIVETVKNLAKDLVELEFLAIEPPQFTDQENTYAKKLIEIITEFTGSTPTRIKKHGGSDLRHFDAIGVQGILFGLKGDNLHADNESVAIDSINTHYQVLKKFLLSLK